MDLKKFPRSAIFNLKNWLFEFYQTIYYYSTRNISLDVSKKIPIARKMIILYDFSWNTLCTRVFLFVEDRFTAESYGHRRGRDTDEE